MPSRRRTLAVETALREIRSSFASVELADGVTIHQAEAIDCYAGAEAIASARLLDLYVRWQDIPDELLTKFESTLWHADPAGFRFHIPAFMTWTLKYASTSSLWVRDITIYSLLPSPRESANEDPRWAFLDAEQRRATAWFLHAACHLKARDMDTRAARDALKYFWSRYLPIGHPCRASADRGPMVSG